MLPVCARATAARAIVTRENIRDGAAGRPNVRWIQSAESLQDLACAPTAPRMLRKNEINRCQRCRVRRRQRRSAVLLQPTHAQRQHALTPFVARRATNAVPRAQLRYGSRSTREVLRKMQPFKYGVGLLPGHRRLSKWDVGKCHPCPRTGVNHVPVLYRRLPNLALHIDDPQLRFDDTPLGCARHGDRTSTRPDCCCRRPNFGRTSTLLRPECTRQRDCSRERSPSWTAWTGAGKRSPTRETIPRMQQYDQHAPSSSLLYKCVCRFDHLSKQRASASTATRPTATGRRHDSAA